MAWKWWIDWKVRRKHLLEEGMRLTARVELKPDAREVQARMDINSDRKTLKNTRKSVRMSENPRSVAAYGPEMCEEGRSTNREPARSPGTRWKPVNEGFTSARRA